MLIDCISDLHGFYPELPGGDLLLVAGDLTKCDTINEYRTFAHWLWEQDYRCKVFIAGNHDNKLKDFLLEWVPMCEAQYLEDSGYDFEGVKIWGTPWTEKFWGQNPRAMAFALADDELLSEKWALIPEDTNILITHTPPYEILDKSYNLKRCGSRSLRFRLGNFLPDLKLHVFGHIHEGSGKKSNAGSSLIFVNATHVDERYKPIHEHTRLEL